MVARENSTRDKSRTAVERSLGVPSLLLELKHDRGWPDVVFLVPGGRPLLMEFKRPNRELEPLQLDRRDTLQKLGYNAVGPVSSVTEAVLLVQQAIPTSTEQPFEAATRNAALMYGR